MKILAIRGKNLASLADEFEVNFNQSPLKEAGIFAITGTTGSGKSTLLDAVCLALFDDTPRLHHAVENKVYVPDVKDETISLSDSRNLLRKGCGYAYAEVEFSSLGGEVYRARWTTRRAGEKAGGKLQSVKIELFNLSADCEVPGGKTALLTKISELIGLNYNQFTRSVLLAQGDFATFMKAQQAEKAELLEKLTGTDIYSRISMQIHQHCADAKKELDTLLARMDGLTLLPDEELQALSAEHAQLEAATKDIAARNTKLNASLNWLVKKDQLTKLLRAGENALTQREEAHARAEERRHYLALLDSVQEVRDCYTKWKEAQSAIARAETGKAPLEAAIVVATEDLKKAKECVAQRQEDKAAEAKRWADLAPVVKEARALDVQLKGAHDVESVAATEHQKAIKAHDNNRKAVASRERELTAAQQTYTDCEQWFKDNASYSGVVADYARIHTLIGDYDREKSSKVGYEQSLKSTLGLLSSKQERKAALEQEAEQLNHLLPEEISVIRLQLQDGAPCPVCGSTLHPYAGLLDEKVLKEKEIEKRRKELKNDLDSVVKAITDCEADISGYKALIGQGEIRIANLFAALKDSVSAVPDWQKLLEQQKLDEQLKNLSLTWKKKENDKQSAAVKRDAAQQALTFLLEQGEQNAKEVQERENLHLATTATLNTLTEARAKLLDGRPADTVEAEHERCVKRQQDAEAAALANQQRCSGALEQRKGELSQLLQSLKDNASIVKDLQAQLTQWLQARPDGMDMPLLAELTARDMGWVAEERDSLNNLNQALTAARTTVTERRQALTAHEQSPDKPEPEHTPESLKQTLTNLEEVQKEKDKKKSEIAGRLLMHEQNKKRRSAYEEELNEKTDVYEAWSKLNILFGSAKGEKFRLMAQGYTLDALLVYANKHLKDLSGRYSLLRIPDTLALQVVDHDMLGENRAVHSLSGGESFLISLALALGLASLSSNRMHVESLFIDEGFGSLDSETLRVAMDTLERLQTQGRKIGVISHVAEMTERIPVRIRVKKKTGGSSKIEVEG